MIKIHSNHSLFYCLFPENSCSYGLSLNFLKMIKRFLTTLFLILLCGCSAWQYHKPIDVEIAEGMKFKLIDLKVINQNISQKQRIHGSFEELFFNTSILTKLTPQSLEIVGLAPVMGTRIFTLKYDNKTISVEHSKLIEIDPRIKPEYVVADVQLIYAATNDIAKNLDKNCKISEKKDGEKLYRIIAKKVGKAKNSYQPIIEITYSNNDSSPQEIHYKHFERRYEYFLKSPNQK